MIHCMRVETFNHLFARLLRNLNYAGVFGLSALFIYTCLRIVNLYQGLETSQI